MFNNINKDTIFDINKLTVAFKFGKNIFTANRKGNDIVALNNINLKIFAGEVLGLVGETGCGKTTLGKALLLVNENFTGEIIFKGNSIKNLSNKEKKQYFQKCQLIYQDPFSSLNPRMKVSEILYRPLKIFFNLKKNEIEKIIKDRVVHFGLTSYDLNKYPHEFSGGQRQRIAIARALIINPEFVVADEPTSSLDVSVQARILNMLKNLVLTFNFTMVFISHNISVIYFLSDRIAVMYKGEIVEILEKNKLFVNPMHPYTIKLLESTPKGQVKLINSCKTKMIIAEENKIQAIFENDLKGCNYYNYCKFRKDFCKEKTPTLKEIGYKHQIACNLYQILSKND